MSEPAATLEAVLAELRDLRAALRGRATKRQRRRLDPLLLPLQHAAELLGVGMPVLKELIGSGELLQVTTIKGDPRITRRSLEEYVRKLEDLARKAPHAQKPRAQRKSARKGPALTAAELAARIDKIKVT